MNDVSSSALLRCGAATTTPATTCWRPTSWWWCWYLSCCTVLYCTVLYCTVLYCTGPAPPHLRPEPAPLPHHPHNLPPPPSSLRGQADQGPQGRHVNNVWGCLEASHMKMYQGFCCWQCCDWLTALWVCVYWLSVHFWLALAHRLMNQLIQKASF